MAIISSNIGDNDFSFRKKELRLVDSKNIPEEKRNNNLNLALPLNLKEFIGIITHKGYVNTSASAEDIASNIDEIRTIVDGTYPFSNEDELVIIQKAIQGN